MNALTFNSLLIEPSITMYNEWDRIVMRTIVQDALSSVISDIQSASIAQWLEPRLSYPVVVGSSLGGADTFLPH